MFRATDSGGRHILFLSLFISILIYFDHPLFAQIVFQDFNELDDLTEFRSTSPDTSQVDRINLNPVTSDGSAVFTLEGEGEEKFLRVNKRGRNIRHFDRTTGIEDAATLLISFDFELISTEQEGRIATWYIGDDLNPNSFFPNIPEKWAEIGIFANPSDNSFFLSSESENISSRSNSSYTGKRRVSIIANNSGESIIYDSPDGLSSLLPDESIHLWVDQDRQAVTTRPFLGSSAQQINAVKFLVWLNDNNAVFHIDNLLIAELDIEPLPVELLEFTARAQEVDVVLEWQTATEKNSSYFEIERSLDGESFSSLGQVPSSGNSNQLKSYSFTDQHAARELGGSVYYRLKIVDIDNSFEYSPVELISLRGYSFQVLSVSPNPFREKLTLAVESHEEQVVDLELLDQQGILLLQQQQYLRPGVPELSIRELGNLSPGIYFLRVKAADYQAHYRLLKW